MNKVFLMQPRQTGKTTKALNKFLEDPDNTIFVVKHNGYLKDIINKIDYYEESYRKNFFTPSMLIKGLLYGIAPKNIILDEYMFYEEKNEIYNLIRNNPPENLYIFSTSDTIYNKKIYNHIKENKFKKMYYQILDEYDGLINKYIKNEFDDLYYNFLSDPDTILICDFYKKKYVDLHNKILIGDTQYNIEYNNNFLY